MNIRMASAEEMKALWNHSNTPTARYFYEGIKQNNIEFWTIQHNNELIGELYIFWNSKDQDEADGKKRAYLCAYRIHKDFQGQGLGRKLMHRVIDRVKEKGFKEVTIGVDHYDKTLTSLYNSYGFDTFVKFKHVDHHNLDHNDNPRPVETPTAVYLKKI